MIKLYLSDPYQNNKKLSAIPFDHPDLISPTLAFDYKQPTLFKFILNPNYPFWQEFFDNPKLGVILETGDYIFSFYLYRQAQSNRGNGAIELTFISTLDLLNTNKSRAYPLFNIYKDTSCFGLAKLLENVAITQVGQDKNVSFSVGTLESLEVLTQITNQAGFQWVDGGIDQAGVNLIEIGNFNQKQVVGTIRGEIVPNTPYLSDMPKTNLNGQYFSHLLALGGSSQGGDGESVYTLTNPRASYIDPDYPLDDIGSRDKDGNIVYYILDSLAFKKRGFRSILQYQYDQSPNSSQTEANIEPVEIDLEKAQETLYKNGVNYLKKQSYGQSISLSLYPDKIYLPGTKLNLDIEYKVDTDRALLRTFVANEPYFIKNIEYNLENYV